MSRAAWPLAAGVAVLALTACANSGSVGIGAVSIPVPGMTAGKLTDQESIAIALDDVEEGMERRRIYKVLAHVSKNYQDDEGRDYEAITAYLNDIFDRYRDIRITRTRPIIQVSGQRATAVETFGTQADPVDAARDIPIHVQGQVSVSLEKADGQWLITEWGRLR